MPFFSLYACVCLVWVCVIYNYEKKILRDFGQWLLNNCLIIDIVKQNYGSFYFFFTVNCVWFLRLHIIDGCAFTIHIVIHYILLTRHCLKPDRSQSVALGLVRTASDLNALVWLFKKVFLKCGEYTSCFLKAPIFVVDMQLKFVSLLCHSALIHC